MTSANDVNWDGVKTSLERGKTYIQVAAENGVNVNTMISWCKQRGIKKRQLAKAHLQSSVGAALVEVGRTYGRRMMTGYLESSRAISASRAAVSSALSKADPGGMATRRARVVVSNPIPYKATHFGHKLHIDQNEKLIMFGVLQAACIDGHSGKIVGHVVLPEKNTMLLYTDLFQPIVQQYGIWDQLRADHGMEWSLILYAVNLMETHRRNKEKPPFVQTFSKKNLRIERWWVEVNKRVNYPIKRLLIEMAEDGTLPTETANDNHIVEEFVRRVVRVGVQRLVDTWNCHTIDKRGKPNDCVVNSAPIPATEIVEVNDLVTSYERNGGKITRPRSVDSIPDEILAEARDHQFITQQSPFSEIFNLVVAENALAFNEALMTYVAITKTFQPA